MEMVYQGKTLTVPDKYFSGGVPTGALADFLLQHVLRPRGIGVVTRCDQAPEPAAGCRCVYVATVVEPGGYRFEGTPGELFVSMAGWQWAQDFQIATAAREAAVLQALLEYGGCSDLARRYRQAVRARIRRRQPPSPSPPSPPSAPSSCPRRGADRDAAASTGTAAAPAEGARGEAALAAGVHAAAAPAAADAPAVFTAPVHASFCGLTPAEVYRRYRHEYRWQLAVMLSQERDALAAQRETGSALYRDLDAVLGQIDALLQSRIPRLVAALQQRPGTDGDAADLGAVVREALGPALTARYPDLIVCSASGELAALDFRQPGLTETEAMQIAARVAQALEAQVMERTVQPAAAAPVA